MSQFVSNNQEFNIVSEAELSEMLNHFNGDFIIDIVRNQLDMKNNSYTEKSNIINSLEENFKFMSSQYADGKDDIEQVRTETYLQVIDLLCHEYNLRFNDDQDIDYYTAALYLWDFLVANFRNYLVNFFTTYITREKKGLYDTLKLDRYKKVKDTTILYGKKVYSDNDIIIISANIVEVLRYMFGFDISLKNILDLSYDKPRSEYINSLVTDMNGNFYQNVYCKELNENMGEFITDIRLSIQKMYIDDRDINTVLKEEI